KIEEDLEEERFADENSHSDHDRDRSIKNANSIVLRDRAIHWDELNAMSDEFIAEIKTREREEAIKNDNNDNNNPKEANYSLHQFFVQFDRTLSFDQRKKIED